MDTWNSFIGCWPLPRPPFAGEGISFIKTYLALNPPHLKNTLPRPNLHFSSSISLGWWVRERERESGKMERRTVERNEEVERTHYPDPICTSHLLLVLADGGEWGKEMERRTERWKEEWRGRENTLPRPNLHFSSSISLGWWGRWERERRKDVERNEEVERTHYPDPICTSHLLLVLADGESEGKKWRRTERWREEWRGRENTLPRPNLHFSSSISLGWWGRVRERNGEKNRKMERGMKR